MTFQTGDVVKLRCGSPPMTVHDQVEDSVKVVWFSQFADGSYATSGPLFATFPSDTLTKVSE